MLRIIRYIFFIAMLPLMACTKSEFKLNFELGSDVTENYNVIYYATDKKGGLTIQAVASVREGKCELKGFTKKPTLVYISTRRSSFPLVLLAERGKDIHIQGETNAPLSWDVMENKINSQLSEWRKENLESLENNKTESVNEAVKKFVEENPDNPVSTILLLCYYTRAKDEREYTHLLSSLDGDARKDEWFRIIGRADQPYPTNNMPARLESLILNSDNEEGDTLRIDGKHPVFLAFWQTGESMEKHEITDSLKNLIKDIPENERIIGDVCLDIDSMAWRNAIRRDSLKDVKRFWVAMGLTDPTVMKFKVGSIPYFIVFDKDGKQIYRGGELAGAMRAYRNASRKSKG